MPKKAAYPLLVFDKKNWLQTDFHRPRHYAKFDVNLWDGENQRGIDFIVPKHLLLLLRIVSEHNVGPAVQFWGRTLDKTFFKGKNLCANIYIYCPILHG